MNHTQAQLANLIPGQRQPQNNAQNGSMNGGGYYITPPTNVQQPPQSFSGGYPENQMGGNMYDVYQPSGQTCPPQQPANYYYPHPPYQMPVAQINPTAYIQQQMHMNGHYMPKYSVNNPPPSSVYPAQQPPQQQVSTQPPKTRERKALKIIDPVSGAVINDEIESEPPNPLPDDEQPQQIQQPKQEEVEASSDDIQRRFRSTISAIVNSDASKDQQRSDKSAAPSPVVSKVIQQPTPASSAPPPSINVAEDPASPKIKAASAEPTVQAESTFQMNEAKLSVDYGASPVQTPTPDARDQLMQEEEDCEKLFKLENDFKNLYDSNADDIEKKVYSLDVLKMIHEIVRCYKKTIPPVSIELLKLKGLDLNSDLPQQTQSRKYQTPTNIFNPGWNQQQQVFSINRKIYAGRHSHSDGNKNRNKNRIPPRASYGPRQPAQVLDLRKAEVAWKPKRRDDGSTSEDDKKYENVRKEIRSILNKITPTSYDELIKDFFNINVAQDERYQQIAIELIFDKAVEEPKFCSLYTKLCKEQSDRGTRTKSSFYHTLIMKVQKTFEGNSAFDNNIKDITSQLEKETDEKKKVDLEERLEMLKEKEKRYILGNIKFISHLYIVDLIMDHVISFCLSKLHQMFDATKDDIYVQYGIELLELIAKIYFSEEKKIQRERNAEAQKAQMTDAQRIANSQKPQSTHDNVQSFVNWVSTDGCKNAVSTKIKVMIMNFEDFLKAGYIKRSTDTGPKKIHEVHEDVRKEEERNRIDRLAYESTHKNQRDTRPQYIGRASYDKKNTQEKRMSAAAASNNTGNSAPARNFNLKIIKDSNQKLGAKSSNFFNKKTEEDAKNDPSEWLFTSSGKGVGSSNQSRKSSLERN